MRFVCKGLRESEGMLKLVMPPYRTIHRGCGVQGQCSLGGVEVSLNPILVVEVARGYGGMGAIGKVYPRGC